MVVTLTVPSGAGVTVLLDEYPDLTFDFDFGEEDGRDYFIGEESEEEDGDEWLTHDEAIAFCGFAEGAIPGASTLISGNGDWAQGLLSQRDFSGYHWEPEYLTERQRNSTIWWEAHERGKALRKEV